MAMVKKNTYSQNIRIEKERASRDKLSTFFYNLAQMTFAATALVGGPAILSGDGGLMHFVMLLSGLAITFVFAYIGHRIINN